MGFEIKYSFELFFPPMVFLILVFTFSFGLFLFVNLWNPFMKRKILHLIISVIVLAISGWIILGTVLSSIRLYQEVYMPYQNDEYLVVEGEIQDFSPSPFEYVISGGSDTFTVQGISFEVGNFNLAGLRRNAANGGPIREEGQWVRIFYERSGNRNFIVRVEC